MRRLLTVICTLLLSASVSGQQIKSRPVGFDDFRSLLEAVGYEAFGFDPVSYTHLTLPTT